MNESPADFGVYPDNWSTFELFWVVKEQWIVVAGFESIHYQAFNFAQIESACRMLGIENTKPLFEDLLIMQNAAKEILNQK